MKKHYKLTFIPGIAAVILLAGSYARADMGGACRVSPGDKLMKKIDLIYDNQEDLEITDKQLDELKGIKHSYRKESIKKNAEIEILDIDINSLLYEDPVDLEKVNKLVDSKYELKKSRTKAAIAAGAKLKDTLTDKQKEKLKNLWRSECERMRPSKDSCPGGGMMQGGMMMRGNRMQQDK
ncbi:MAG: hypothetical protein JXJ19_01515 [Elusimicrobia bacterium]|nr:hypothetical protein [Elusimicrobiota bacterium]